MKAKDWEVVAALIMKWAQDDGTNDELMDLLPVEDRMDPSAFWEEFEARLKKGFGK